tara:strand:- start:1947 stop:2255 length:309 start_codon:yes stop_codon:yes gene_type:complete
MNELKQHTLKVRVKELENRLNNLKALVDNIAFNQEQIVKAFEVDAEVVEPTKLNNQLRIDDEAARLECCDDSDCKDYECDNNSRCGDEQCDDKVCLVNKCKD